MNRNRLTGLILAGLTAAGLAGLAWWLGSPLLASLAALSGGIVLGAVAWRRGASSAASVAEDGNLTEGPTLNELLAAIEEPLLLVANRRVMHANDAARALLGGHIESVDVRLAIRHPAAAELLAGDAGEDIDGDVEIVGLGDANRPWLIQVRALPDGSRLVRLIDQGAARAAEQMRVDFVANASHELRTPLATFLGFLETLEDEATAGNAETRTHFLSIMTREARRMRDLVDDLVSLSRIEAERFAAPRDPVDLLSVVDDVRESLDQPIAARGVELIVETDATHPVVQGDRSQLVQLLANLVANALKYGREGRPIRVRLAQAAGDMLCVEVIDEGEGIAPEHLPRLTERFYRVEASRSRQAGGTGLGLAIVKHIVLRHRGRLDIASTLGTGTTVSVYLPRANVTEPSSR